MFQIPDLSSLLSGRSDRQRLMCRSHLDPPPSGELLEHLSRPHTTSHYFLLFVESGEVRYLVDLTEVPVSAGQVLFVQPRQIRMPPSEKGNAEYFKIAFDETLFCRLPRRYRFWYDPWDDRTISLNAHSRERVAGLFSLLRQTVRVEGVDSNLVVPYLSAIMSELEHAYFGAGRRAPGTRSVETYVRFQELVERRFVRRPRVSRLADELGMSESALYEMVRAFGGCSPKEYLNRRTILEARRLLFYSEMTVKELARRLGFEDENYLSRFFRKRTGRTITSFIAETGDSSRGSEDSSISELDPES